MVQLPHFIKQPVGQHLIEDVKIAVPRLADAAVKHALRLTEVLLELPPLGAEHLRAGQPRRQPFYGDTHIQQHHVIARLHFVHRIPLGALFQKPLCLQPEKCLPHRRAADVHVDGDLLLIELFPRLQLVVDDLVAQNGIHKIRV